MMTPAGVNEMGPALPVRGAYDVVIVGGGGAMGGLLGGLFAPGDRREADGDIRDIAIIGGVAAIQSGPPPRARRAMIVVSRAGGTIDDVSVAGAGTFLDQLLRMAGGKNVFERSVVPYPQPGLEEILHRNPEVILELRPEGVDAAVESRAALSAWSALPGLEVLGAVQAEDGHVAHAAGLLAAVGGSV